MGDWATVPADHGVFLEHTWRMHPKLCRFVSDAFCDWRLESAECTFGQMLELSNDLDGVLGPFGLRFVSVDHENNAQRSIKEAAQLDHVYRSLEGIRAAASKY